MGIAPVESIKGLLKKSNLNMDQVETIEVSFDFKLFYVFKGK